tara:strand:+ start:425 stop:694 length:270 start_codon:yes stop_codon:yes gene_type:complete
MTYKMNGFSGFGNSPLKKEIPPRISKLTKTNYKQSKSLSFPNEKTATNYDEHNVHAEDTDPTDGRWCATCGVAKEDHNATHSFKPNYEK